MQFPHLLLALILVGIAGCKPAVVQPEAVEAESDPFNEPATRLYTVLNDPWNTYFRTEPKILALPALSTGIAHILTEEQKRIKAVLDLNAAPGKSSDYAELDDRLADLKSYIPSAEVSSGYVRTLPHVRRLFLQQWRLLHCQNRRLLQRIWQLST